MSSAVTPCLTPIGFWAPSPAVVIEGNHAFHHADAAYAVITLPLKEYGKTVKFAGENLTAETHSSAWDNFVSPQIVPSRFERNAGGSCRKGLEIWTVNTSAEHNVPSLIAGCQFWHTPAAGIDMPYTFQTVIRDMTVLSRANSRYPAIGVHVNTSTRFLTLERVTVAGFTAGIDVPVRGHTRHGIEICGLLHDEVGGVPTIKNMFKEFKDLKVDPDG